MPLHIAPALRAREEAAEAAGLIQSLDSVGVTIAKAQEAQGQVAKIVPKTTFQFNNNTFTSR